MTDDCEQINLGELLLKTSSLNTHRLLDPVNALLGLNFKSSLK